MLRGAEDAHEEKVDAVCKTEKSFIYDLILFKNICFDS